MTAGLHLGTLFPYALARTRGLSLLVKGRDSSRTDVECATTPGT